MSEMHIDHQLKIILQNETTDVVKSRIYSRPLSMYHYYIQHDSNNKNICAKNSNASITPPITLAVAIDKPNNGFYKRGAIFYHGHNDSYKIYTKVKFIDYWYTIDFNAKSYPDYIANLFDVDAMSYFPDNYFDCVLIKNAITDYCDINIALQNLRRIVRDNGTILLMHILDYFHYFVNTNEYEFVKDKIDDLIDKNTLDSLKTEFNCEAETTNNKDFYIFVLQSSFKAPSKNVLLQIIKEKALQVIRRVLSENGFQYVNTKSKIVIAKKKK